MQGWLSRVYQGQTAWTRDGKLGKVVEVLVGTPEEGSFVGVRVGSVFKSSEYFIPEADIEIVRDDEVRFSKTRAEIEHSQHTRPAAFAR